MDKLDNPDLRFNAKVAYATGRICYLDGGKYYGNIKIIWPERTDAAVGPASKLA